MGMREKGPSLVEAAQYVERFRDAIVVVKIGGDLQIGERVMTRLARQVEVLVRCGLRPVVVHGGGAQIDAVCDERQLEVTKVAGRRVTSPEVMAVVLDVVAGDLNRQLVGLLEGTGVAVRGWSGGLEGVIRCTRRPPVTFEGEEVDFGEVGDVESVDTAPLTANGAGWTVPVLPCIGQTAEGAHLNVNADTVASRVAVALQAQKLVMLSRVAGVMTSPDAAGPISRLDIPQARALIDGGQAVGGMRAKLVEAIRALEGGVPQVHIISGVAPHTLLHEIFTREGCGTLMTAGPAGPAVERTS